jgi:hypothetical protein
MRRIALLLMVMASTLLVASGVAWAVTKTCPPEPKQCKGTSGADVLKSTSRNNDMVGLAGNDTYTNFVRGKSGIDTILDKAGRDKLVLTNYRERELRFVLLDVNENRKVDSLYIGLGSRKNAVYILGFFDDRSRKCPCKPGFGYIENILVR